MNALPAPTHSEDDVFLRPNIDSIDLMGKVMLCVGRTADGYVFRETGVEGLNTVIEASRIKRFWTAGMLAFVSASEDDLPPAVRKALTTQRSAFTDKENREIDRRLRYVEAVDALGPDFSRSATTLQPVCDRIALETGDSKPHGWYAVYRWWRLWKLAERDPRALKRFDRDKGNRKSRLDPVREAAIEEAIKQTWLTRRRPLMTTAQSHANARVTEQFGGHDAVKEAIAQRKSPLVSYEAVRRRCRKVPRLTRLHSRHGPDATRKEITPVGAGPRVVLPFERVETDFKYVGLFLVDEGTGLPLGTPYLMAAFDCFSGAVAGFSIGFDPPGRALAARCLKHAIGFKDLSDLPKDEDGEPVVRNRWPMNGAPFRFVLDNDVAFHSDHFFAAAKSLGSHVDFIAPGEPWKKGAIERFWQTCQQVFFDMFPGKVLRLVDRPGQDYKPDEDPVLTLGQVRTFLTKAIVDVHNQGIDEESGLKRIDLWLQGVAAHRPKQPRRHEDLMELVGGYANRKAERRGIRIFGLRYNSRDLAYFRAGFREDPRVDVRYDPDDLGKVWVVDPRSGGTLAIPCTRRDYAEGLSLHQHRVIRAHAANRYPGGRRLLMQELLLARADLFRLGQKMIGETKGRGMRQRLAHFLGTNRSILDAYAYREDDPKASRGQMLGGAAANDPEYDIDEDIEDADDAARAREDEAFVDAIVKGGADDGPAREASKAGGSRGRRSKAPAPVAPTPETPATGAGEAADAIGESGRAERAGPSDEAPDRPAEPAASAPDAPAPTPRPRRPPSLGPRILKHGE